MKTRTRNLLITEGMLIVLAILSGRYNSVGEIMYWSMILQETIYPLFNSYLFIKYIANYFVHKYELLLMVGMGLVSMVVNPISILVPILIAMLVNKLRNTITKKTSVNKRKG